MTISRPDKQEFLGIPNPCIPTLLNLSAPPFLKHLRASINSVFLQTYTVDYSGDPLSRFHKETTLPSYTYRGQHERSNSHGVEEKHSYPQM